MFQQILAAIFGCQHQRMTSVQKALDIEAYHVTCLDCGSEFDYDWANMRLGKLIANTETPRTWQRADAIRRGDAV